jgi:tRNA1Val (adenine37-N6)-methyltransferase
MSNSFFHFKQFTIKQDKCAMKVSTDACIFGAMLQPCAGAKKALDIGAGTGLLSLMLAQRNINLQIDAVELIEDAYLQAKQNVAESKYASLHFLKMI